MTDPAWGLRVLGFATASSIVSLVGLDQLHQPLDASHLVVVGTSLVSAVLFARLRPSSSRRLAAWLLPVGPAAGCAYVTTAMQLVGSDVIATGLALLQLWFVTYCALYGRRWHTALALATTGAGLLLGLRPHIGGADAALFAVTAVVVLAVAALLLTAVSEQVRRASLTDALTGALTRRGLAEEADRFARRHRGRHQHVAVVALDLDGFKAYNDVHGHASGDELLVRAVASWRQVLPPGSLLARTGGDEFAAVVAGRTLGTPVGQDLLEALRRAVPEGVRASAGAATWVVGTPLESSTHSADLAMYADKGQRRRGDGPALAPPEAAVTTSP